jgi:hypothetical protein
MNHEEFTIEYQWKQFLIAAKVSEEELPEVQRTELKKCFFAAAGQIMVLLRDKISAIEDLEEATQVLRNMAEEVQTFWIQQIAEQAGYVKRVASEDQQRKMN